MSTPQETRTPRTDAEAEISAGDYYLDGTVSVHFARTLEQELSRATQELEQVKRERDGYQKAAENMASQSAQLWAIRQEIEGEGFEEMGDLHLTIRGAIATLRASNEALRGALEDAKANLKAIHDANPEDRLLAAVLAHEAIDRVLAATPPASPPPVALPGAVKEAAEKIDEALVEAHCLIDDEVRHKPKQRAAALRELERARRTLLSFIQQQ